MHILFDLDGTLFQTRDIVLFAARAVYDELGIKGAEDPRIIESIGRPSDVFLKNIFPHNVCVEEIREKFRGYEHQAIHEKGMLFPGIKEVLRELSDAGHELSICSNGRIDYIELVLGVTGIRNYFSSVYSARDYESKARFVAQLMSPDEKVVFIGDSYDDIEAGFENHIPSIAVMYGYGKKEYLDKATCFAVAPQEITGYINQINIFSILTERLIKNGKKIIGINGVDTSGKTTFTETFARYLQVIGYEAVVIHMDDFHNPLSRRKEGADEIDAYYRNAFNYSQLTDELLLPLKQNGCVDKEVLCLNLDTDNYENRRYYSINRDTVVLVEGVLLFRPPLSEYFEGRIFLQIGFDEVLKRAEARDVPKYGSTFLKKYLEKYIPVQKRYLEEFAPHLNCDIVIDNVDFQHPSVNDRSGF